MKAGKPAAERPAISGSERASDPCRPKPCGPIGNVLFIRIPV